MTRFARYQWMRAFLTVAALVVVILQSLPARAEIYEWIDSENNRHFVTSLDHVPPSARGKSRLLARGEPPHGGGDATTSVGEVRPSTAQPTAGPTGDIPPDAFASGWDAGFSAGWNEGYRAAKDEEPICRAEPEVVVLETPVMVNVPLYDPTGAYYVSPYQGTVTVPFDAGRSFGLTRRQQIQEQRRIERGW
jgi:hypothetical protein